jgi:rod shape-determining protein MreC
MSRFFKSRFFIGTISFTVIVLVVMMLSTVDRVKSPFISNAVGIVVTPVQKFFWNIGNGVSGFFIKFKDMAEYQTRYEQAQETIKKLEDDTRELYKLQSENSRLRNLLSLKEENGRYDMIGAEVVAKDSGNWYSTFIIDKGAAAGVSKKDVVITDKGLVGYVYEVGETWGKVISIIDSKSSLGGIIERTNDRAVVEGDLKFMEEGLCKASYISKSATLIVGDYVETSGLGGIYPAGLLIGKVENITVDSQGLYNEAVIETAVDFARIKEVMIIRQKGE